MTGIALAVVVMAEIAVILAYLLSFLPASIRERRRMVEVRIAEGFRRAVVDSLVADRVEPGIEDLSAGAPRRCDDMLCDVLQQVRSRRNPVIVELAMATGFVRRAEEDLRSSRWWVRRAALRRLGVVGGSTPHPGLIDDPSPEVRAAAVHHMAIADPDDAADDVAVALLTDPSPLVGQAAREAVVHLGSAAVPALRRILEEPTSNEQLLAVLSLVAQSGDASLGRLSRRYLDRREPEIVAAAVRAVGSRATGEDVGRLAELLRTGNPIIQLAVIETGAASGLWQLSGSVAACLSGSDPAVVDAAGRSLGEFGDGGRLLVSKLARTAW